MKRIELKNGCYKDININRIIRYFNKNCLLHREDGPAIEYPDGYKQWLINGQFHRKDGPAVYGLNGHKEWLINGKRHREDGPAVEYEDGYKAWYINDKRHREDGPAVIYNDGEKFWFINDKQLFEFQFHKYIKFKKLYDDAKSFIEKQSAELLMEMVINEKD